MTTAAHRGRSGRPAPTDLSDGCIRASCLRQSRWRWYPLVDHGQQNPFMTSPGPLLTVIGDLPSCSTLRQGDHVMREIVRTRQMRQYIATLTELSSGSGLLF